MHLKQKIEKYMHHIIFAIIVCIFVVVNHVPLGTVIASGDFYQLLDPVHNVSRYLYMWLTQHGQGGFNYLAPSWPYYMLIGFVDRLGGSISIQATFTMILLVVGSYMTAWWATGLFVNDRWTRWILTIFYACNSVIFSFFFYSWGYVHHFLIYIFLPPLILGFLKVLMDEHNRDQYTYILILRFLVATIGFNNLGFLAAIVLLYLLIGVSFLAFGIVRINANLMKNMLTFVIACFFAFGRYVLAFYMSQSFFSEKISSSHIFGGNIQGIIAATSNTVLNSLRLYIGDFFNTPFFVFQLIYPLCLIPGVLLLKNKYKPFMALLIVFGIFVVLSTRFGSIFTWLNTFLFQFHFFQLFRSPDKIFIMLPALYLALYSMIYTHQLVVKKQIRFMLLWVLVCIVPFLGNHIKEGFYKYSSDNPSIAVHVPSSYTDIVKTINNDERSIGILSLPNVAVTSLNWANYPSRGLVGADLLHTLYNKPYFSANSYDHPTLETQMSLAHMGSASGNVQDLIDAVELFGAGYVVLHRIVPTASTAGLQKIANILNTAENTKLLDLLYTNPLFNLYKVSNPFVQSTLSVSSGTLYFQKYNPILYEGYIVGSGSVDIVLRQGFDTQRRFLITENKQNFATDCTNPNTYRQGKSITYECYNTNILFHIGSIIKGLLIDDTVTDHTMYKTFGNSRSFDLPHNNAGTHFYIFYIPQLFLYFGLLSQIILFVRVIYALKKHYS